MKRLLTIFLFGLVLSSCETEFKPENPKAYDSYVTVYGDDAATELSRQYAGRKSGIHKSKSSAKVVDTHIGEDGKTIYVFKISTEEPHD